MEGMAKQEQLLRSMVRDIVGDENIRAYRILDITHTFRDTLIIAALLIGAVSSVIYLHASYGLIAMTAIPLVVVVTSVAFNWINVQVHEASHCFLLPNKTWNDVYCNTVLGAWALQDVETYRATHGMHHAYLHSERDPDRWVYTERVGSPRQMLRGIADDLFMVTALRRVRQVGKVVRANASPAPRYILFAKLSAQMFVLGVFLWGCGAWGFIYYLLCYVYGLLAVFTVLVRIRTVVQHCDGGLAKKTGIARFVSRTTMAPLLEFILVGARMDYHFEHHLFPNLPYYNLGLMHQKLNEAGIFKQMLSEGGVSLRTRNYLQTYVDLATA